MSKKNIPITEYKHISFDDWKPWDLRLKLSEEFDVPEEFGIYGIYLVAEFETAPEVRKITPISIPEEVIYIGMSSHVDRRLEKSHSAIRKYMEESGDSNCEKLWFGRAQSSWTNSQLEGQAVATAYMAYYERALILEYTRSYGKFPRFNKA